MNMQAMMREAQKLQKELMKAQEELESSTYEGHSSLVTVKINGNKELVSINIDKDNSLEKDDIEMLEDMIMVAINDAVKKADADKQQKLGKYGSGLSGLM
jgi:hypothetical protein